MEKGGARLLKFVTTMICTVVPIIKVSEAGTPLTIVTVCVLPSCVKVKVPGGDSVPAAYKSHTLVLSGKRMLGSNAV